MSDIWTDGEWNRLLGRQPCSWKTPVTPRPAALGPRPGHPARKPGPPPLPVRAPRIPSRPQLSNLEELSGLRELPGVPLAKAGTLRPATAAQVSRATDSLIATMVTLPGAAPRPTEATGEIDTGPLAAPGLSRCLVALLVSAIAALLTVLGAARGIGAVSLEYVGAEWVQAGLLAATALTAVVAASVCRLVLGRRAGWMVIGAGIVGLGIGWAARLAIGGGLADLQLEALSPGAVFAATSAGLRHATALVDVQLLLVWACEAVLLVWFAAALQSRAGAPVAGPSA